MFTNNRECCVYNEGEKSKLLLYSYSKNKLLINKNLLFVQTLKIKKKFFDDNYSDPKHRNRVVDGSLKGFEFLRSPNSN